MVPIGAPVDHATSTSGLAPFSRWGFGDEFDVLVTFAADQRLEILVGVLPAGIGRSDQRDLLPALGAEIAKQRRAEFPGRDTRTVDEAVIRRMDAGREAIEQRAVLHQRRRLI